MKGLHAQSLVVPSWWYSLVLVFIWLCKNTNQPSYSTYHLIGCLPNNCSSTFLSLFCWICFVLPTSLLLLSLSATKKLKSLFLSNTHKRAHTCLDTQSSVLKGFISGAAFYQQSPENTKRLIWQSKENQTASQYTKEVRAAGRSMERQFIHYGCHLQKETGQWRREEVMRKKRGDGGKKRDKIMEEFEVSGRWDGAG